ncbi:hypothetical protein CKM354_000976700 [Cercospora kikuchii]|uniref:RNA-binding protein n=1 Tax=Cercospora kikuchii TaxID=84275 RepID=A0A9P3CY57_9PEZI|nr:uncharacterized protein CKM354_000976700 [Cercospora kikuchii]GIZ46648.1 hypothetical protein CKM354_000976700 [Cercospora kikuchii]
MRFNEADTDLLKTWTVAKLEHVSDADADVLADYVLALVTTDEPEAIAKANCIENLKDFLNDKTEAFVHELFFAIATKSYDPSRPPPKPSKPTYQPPRRASIDPPLQVFNPGVKRGYHDWNRDENQAQHQQPDRPNKHARRGAGGGRGGRGAGRNNYPQPPVPPPGMPPFDPTNPMASFMAMAAAMGMLPPGMPAASVYGQQPAQERCLDFDTKGFCTRGAKCPYDHGSNAYVVPDDHNAARFDTGNELFTAHNGTGTKQKSPASKRGRGRGRRAEFSLQGPTHDSTVTTIVVEQIPQEQFDEQSVRDFFSEFGTIEEVNMMPYKRLAIVKYDSHEAASAAYNSPKAVFSNRFVKVYWYKSPESLPQPMSHEVDGDTEMQDEASEIDIEEVRKRQEEAQQRHEEKQKLIEEARKNRQEVDAKLQELETKKLEIANELAKKQGRPVVSERTLQMREQLAKLEAEARTLGIDPEAVPIDSNWSTPQYHAPGRGGYRGRGRGRGAYRGGWSSVGRGGAVKRLDNRPKTVLVVFKEGTYDAHEEALRSWLLFNAAENASLIRHHDKQDAALITFEQRYQGEIFTDATRKTDFPLHGQVELSWYTGPISSNASHDTDMKIEEPSGTTEAQHDDPPKVEDYDVAHEEDRWG